MEYSIISWRHIAVLGRVGAQPLRNEVFRFHLETEFKARNDFQISQALENEGFRAELVKNQAT